MASKELIKKLRRIEIKSNQLAEEVFSGEYQSGFKGKGMAFEEIRPYYEGDDVRHIDWKASAKYGHTYVKQFSEERERSVFLIVDISKSNLFGKKRDYMTEVAATLALSAEKNNDRVGLMLFAADVEKVIPAGVGRKHVLAILEQMLEAQPSNPGTDIDGALRYFSKIQKRHSILFLISDFMDQGYEKNLQKLSRDHDLVLIRVLDPGEEKIPAGAVYTFEDLETGQRMVFENLKSDYVQSIPSSINERQWIDLRTTEDYIKKLQLFFARRGRR